MENDFTHRLTEIVDANLHNEHFGPEELAAKLGMSHSALHRKIKALYNKTISRFIREWRLEKSKELLQNENLSVSEIAYKVGFGSPTYFNKCFHEYYGIAPGEFKKGEQAKSNETPKSNKKFPKVLFLIVGSVLIFVFAYFYLDGTFSTIKNNSPVEKSIAVRPFNYLGENYEKEYLADALMLEIVNQLSQIQDLRVMSPTSVLPYSDQTDKIIGKKINCSFILSGNLHVEENQMNLILSLVNTADESVVKAFNYKTELEDIIELPGNIAQSVAEELNIELSFEEKKRIEKISTLNLTAYDLFQRGREEHLKYWANNHKTEALETAEGFYSKALEYDSTFARAYTGLAMVYWDKNRWSNYSQNNLLDTLEALVNKAFSFDFELPEAFVMKGEYLKLNGFFEDAEKEYNRAISLNPNEWLAYWGKASLCSYRDDALGIIENLNQVLVRHRGVYLPVILKNMSSAYSSAGFVERAKIILFDKFQLDGDSVQYFYALGDLESSNNNFQKALDYYLEAYKKNPSFLQLLQQIGQCYSFMGQYDKSLFYHKKIIDALDIQNEEYGLLNNDLHRIGYSFFMNGDTVTADYYFNLQVKICLKAIETERAFSDYLRYDLAAVQAFRGENKKAYENLKILAKKERFRKWFLSLIEEDPLFDSLRGEEEFGKFVNEVQIKYLKEHERVNNWLQEHSIL